MASSHKSGRVEGVRSKFDGFLQNLSNLDLTPSTFKDTMTFFKFFSAVART